MSQEQYNQTPIVLEHVARVKNDVKEPGPRDWAQVISELVFNPGFEDALDGLEDFSHIIVVFWMHRSPAWERSMSKIHPQRRADLPLVGVFATHSPFRPNPLGITVVGLLERRGNVLKVAGLDAIDGTPVVDIKSFFPGDPDAQVKIPGWVRQLRQYKTK